MEQARPRIITLTEDGSNTLFIPSMDEHYHSVHGAIQESDHVYINNGFRAHNSKKTVVFEVGFGTGLNAWLTMHSANKENREVIYCTIEKYPLDVSEYTLLNYTNGYEPSDKSLFQLLHQPVWENEIEIVPGFRLCKYKADFLSFELKNLPFFDLVYFDAFAPDKQPEMWLDEHFIKLFNHCNPGALLLTYCAKGSVRRSLTAAGYLVERLPGPPGKREMLRAKKPL
jgi:tRNA U34 5-methylaminomethyl-2-thiouridine-forming methyltransferase MnmC